MSTTLTFFPVDNGDMALLKFADETTVLLDVNIRTEADDPVTSMRDVAKDLRERLKSDADGRPYVDAFVLSHPDADHCRGLERHFHLGPLSAYPDDKKATKDKKIVIREIWSSPVVFRRNERTQTLCSDALAFKTEAKRRVKLNKANNFIVGDGDRIQILGEDIDGKTDDLQPILRKLDESFSVLNGQSSTQFSAFLLGPINPQDEEEEEECLSKNQSSIILNFTLAADDNTPDGAKFLSGGDAEVFIWSRQWLRHSADPSVLEYDLLQTPHHCSWHSLSYDSWSELGEDAEVENDARDALAQARAGAFIVASCKPIADDDSDPPCIRAKREYLDILSGVKGQFFCTGEFPSASAVEPLVFTVTRQGMQAPSIKESGAKSAAIITSVRTPLPHGHP